MLRIGIYVSLHHVHPASDSGGNLTGNTSTMFLSITLPRLEFTAISDILVEPIIGVYQQSCSY